MWSASFGESMWYLLLIPLVLAVLAYSFRRRLISRMLNLPPPKYGVSVERSIAIPMADGIHLLADHYQPNANGDFPTILIRTPYGRGREVFMFGGYPLSELPGQRFAERGYHVVVQGVRGCYDSEGIFDPHVNEAADGKATVDWICQRSWYDGRLALWGPSYLGYTAWAAAISSKDHLKAIVPIITSSENFSVTHPNGAFGLESRLRWSQGITMAQKSRGASFISKVKRRFFSNSEDDLIAAFGHIPLQEADEIAAGQPVLFFREMLANTSNEDSYWRSRDNSRQVAQVEAPAHLIGGWYDYYLNSLLRDYATLRDEGHQPHLTIGPWFHASSGGLMTGLREGIDWFDRQLKGHETESPSHPVRVFVMGAEQWRAMDDFPPPSDPTTYYLASGGELRTDKPEAEPSASTFTYDPANPTPSFGGALLAFRGAGPVDNRELEARPDVLCFTSSEFENSLEFMGQVSLVLYVRSSRPFTDFHGRLCDVLPDGRSINICDGLFRIHPGKGQTQADGSLVITIEFSPTAYSLQPGHRLRLQVSSAAHPRWNRNLGTGEAEATAEKMGAAEQTVLHDLDHLSALQLPLIRLLA